MTDTPSGADAAPSVLPADETFDLRQKAAQHLLSQLDRTESMIACCDAAMREKGGDRFAAANAAVRLMKVSTDMTRALMLAAFGETRHRSLSDAAAPLPRSAPPRPIRFATTSRPSRACSRASSAP